MIDLKIEKVQFLKRGYRVHWSVEDHKRLFNISPLEIFFEFTTRQDLFYVINNFLSFTLPIMAKEYREVRVVSYFEFEPRIKDYWNNLLRRLLSNNFALNWLTKGSGRIIRSSLLKQDVSKGRIGLLFGGGVESNFALSILYKYKPLLISIVGEKWMNNDLRLYGIKKKLEDDLIKEFNLDFQRVYSNAFKLVNKPDSYKNFYITGLLFYWHSLQVCHQFGISTLYKSSEMEEALNFDYYDLSLHPIFLKNIIFEGEPLYLPLFNCYPKIQMLKELSHTPFIKYVYSCYKNTNRRWCGNCSKCYRISEFCERIGIDRNMIGMQEGIVGRREKGSISKHYWALADKLYGKRKFHDFHQLLKYYYKRMFSLALKEIFRFKKKKNAQKSN